MAEMMMVERVARALCRQDAMANNIALLAHLDIETIVDRDWRNYRLVAKNAFAIVVDVLNDR